MLGVLCARPKPWILAALSLVHPIIHPRIVGSPISFVSDGDFRRRYHHSTECRLRSNGGGTGAASIWHAILPSGGDRLSINNLKPKIHHEQKGEGSWNVALDVRPARWLHRSDSAWLLFGVCSCLSPSLDCCGGNLEAESVVEETACVGDTDEISSDRNDRRSVDSSDFKVTGVLADGRCLFRAIVHGAHLRSGEEAPDETRERELADELRARVADELLKRREETEWFIEGDFDMYVKSIQRPNAWGGEPELLMASHVLRIPISVFMTDKSSGRLINIASYGLEYGKDKQTPVKVLFHGYGHYDVLETF
ncbi:OTU domain-containing protein 2-like [Macadamia integrifolia]|uniref:OTU domain-containing protein 2-like n=1 Tax=Macadamia integrifolia TaxID=60698 RepID=UPI001C4F149E|nr:OTU domain-containing protein 2-like [Macadamia integrifolia]